MLHAAERQTRIGSDQAIDKNTARFDLFNESLPLGRVICPGGRTETERRGVREFDSFIDTADAKQRSNGTENLIPIGWRVFGNISENCRFVKISAFEFSRHAHSLPSG